MLKYRVAVAVPGLLLLALGALRLVTRLELGNLVALALWMIAAVVIHDGVVAPATLGAGFLLTRVPPRARRYAQGGLIVAGLVTVIAVPLIRRRGTQPAVKAILLRDYAGNLALLLGLVLATAVVLYLARLLRDRRAAAEGAGAEDATP